MNKPLKDDEISRSVERDIRFNFVLPASQSGIAITDHQWNHLREQVGRISPSESLWSTLCVTFLTVGISFLISVSQLDSAARWIVTIFWMATAVGFACAAVCGIAYWENRKRRLDDIDSVLSYMNEIERTYRG